MRGLGRSTRVEHLAPEGVQPRVHQASRSGTPASPRSRRTLLVVHLHDPALAGSGCVKRRDRCWAPTSSVRRPGHRGRSRSGCRRSPREPRRPARAGRERPGACPRCRGASPRAGRPGGPSVRWATCVATWSARWWVFGQRRARRRAHVHASSQMSSSVRSPIRTRHFGRVSVTGRSRVPRPAASSAAFTTSTLAYHAQRPHGRVDRRTSTRSRSACDFSHSAYAATDSTGVFAVAGPGLERLCLAGGCAVVTEPVLPGDAGQPVAAVVRAGDLGELPRRVGLRRRR